MRRVSPNLQPWLEQYNRLIKELTDKGFKPTPITAREGLANLTRELLTDKPSIAWVQDDLVQTPGYSVPVRIFHPQPESLLPVLIYYHGGGHMAGSVTVYDPLCRKLALACRHIVVCPEYRLAPECPYPAGVHDAYYTARNIWATLGSRGVKYQRHLSLAGDSGGGALCATVSHLAQHDARMGITHQALIYPSLDYTMTLSSIDQNATGYLLEKEKIAWYFDNYFQHAENRRAASPLHMEVTRGFAETLVITAEFCPLRDEGAAYVKKVRDAGCHAEHLHFDDMIHAFMNMEDLVKEACQSVYRTIAKFLSTSHQSNKDGISQRD